ncbi:MAG: VOC family protein [Proteobacteria bacterium]|nr:VOC family protein [Pseudomonadota bacterium]
MPANQTAPVKRTTVVVADLTRSLAFYRDLLGMDVFFEGDIGNPGASGVTAVDCEDLRMVVLSVAGSELGMVGLMEIHGVKPPLAATQWDKRLKTGEAILVIPTENMQSLHEKMVAAGVCVVTPPTRIVVPGRPEIHEMMVRDPDGMVVNLTQRGPLR